MCNFWPRGWSESMRESGKFLRRLQGRRPRKHGQHTDAVGRRRPRFIALRAKAAAGLGEARGPRQHDRRRRNLLFAQAAHGHRRCSRKSAIICTAPAAKRSTASTSTRARFSGPTGALAPPAITIADDRASIFTGRTAKSRLVEPTSDGYHEKNRFTPPDESPITWPLERLELSGRGERAAVHSRYGQGLVL